MDKLLEASQKALQALSSISLNEWDSTSSDSEKVRNNARNARIAANELRYALGHRVKEYTFGIEVPGESPSALTVQEDTEDAARRYAQKLLDGTYHDGGAKVTVLLGVKDA